MVRARQLFEDDLAPSADDFDAKDDLLSQPLTFRGITTPDEEGYWIRLLSLIQRKRRSEAKLAPNTYARILDRQPGGDPTIAVKFHRTDVVVLYPDGKIEYNTGGWTTRTTRERILRWSKGGWSILTTKGSWYWWNHRTGQGAYPDTTRIPFTDGDVIDPDGFLRPQGAITFSNKRRMKVAEGVYADLSHGAPEFYVSCPRCHTVHGGFKNQRAAELNQVCGTCQFEERQALIKRLETEGRPKKR